MDDFNKNKDKKLIYIIIILLIILLILINPFKLVKSYFDKKFLLYRTNHEKVEFNFSSKEQYYPFKGYIDEDYNPSKGYITLKTDSKPAIITCVDSGIIVEKGTNEKLNNYIKIRHVPDDGDIYYSVYGNLPELPSESFLSNVNWINRNTVLYTGYDLNKLYFQILDVNENPIDPTSYIKIN